MERIANFIVDKRHLILAVMLVLCAICCALIPRVAINSDMTKYLPDNSQMHIGMDLIDEQLPNAQVDQTIRVMFANLSESDADAIEEQLKQIPNVSSVDYDADSTAYRKDGYTLFAVNTKYAYNSPEETAIESAIAADYADQDPTIVNNDTTSTVLPLWVLALALGLLLVILFIMCASWVEPFVFMAGIGVAVALNLGTNIMFGSISSTTFSIAAVLQLVLSMDYSIILMNRYRQERVLEESRPAAMKKALVRAFPSIASSAMTTFIGLMMLLFMSFKIGADLGGVLAKGVICSMICVFTVLPALIILFAKPIEATGKPIPHLPTDKLAAFGHRWRRPIAVAFACLFVAAFYLQSQTPISYSTAKSDPIAQVFPTKNTTVVVYHNSDEAQAAQMAAQLQKDSDVTAVDSYATTIGAQRTADDMEAWLKKNADADTLSTDVLKMVYYDYFQHGATPAITLGEFITFMNDDVLASDTFSKEIDADTATQIKALKKYADPAELTAPKTPAQLAAFLDMDQTQVQQLCGLYAQATGSTSTSLSVQQFVNFLADNVLTNATYASQFTQAQSAQIAQAKSLVNTVVSQQKLTADQMSQIMSATGGSSSVDAADMKVLFLLYGGLHEADASWTLSAEQLFDHLSNTMLEDSAFASLLTDSERTQINDAQATLDDAKSKLVGADYSIMSVETELPVESAETTAFLDTLQQDADQYLSAGSYLVGSSAMAWEMQQGFHNELLLITLLTAASIFLVVALTFRTLSIPLLLVLLVQCGVFVTVAVNGLMGYKMYYLAVLIVQCILMGAMIDYAILFTNYYREWRERKPVLPALQEAYHRAINTILTSGSIMVLVTGALGLSGADPVITEICKTISIGALAAVLLILFVLPGLLAAWDRRVTKKDAVPGEPDEGAKTA